MFNTHTEQRRLPRLDPARRRERLRKRAPIAAQRCGGDGATLLRQGFAKLSTEEERCWGVEGLRL